MRPARVPSRRVKLLPWYYTDRKQPSRHVDERDALRADFAAIAGDWRVVGNDLLTSLEDVMAELGITEEDLADV